METALRYAEVERYRYERSQMSPAVTIKPELGDFMKLKVWTRDGGKAVLSSAYADAHRIVAIVLPRIDVCIIRRAKKSLEAGEAVDFGGVVLHGEHLERKGREVRYEDITKLDLKGSFLVVSYKTAKTNKTFRVNVFGIDNGSALVLLLGRLTPADPITLLGHAVTLDV